MESQNKPRVEQQKLGELLEKLVDSIGGGIDKVEATYAGMKITVYSMGPSQIRIDLKE
jgi:hypothetical protein